MSQPKRKKSSLATTSQRSRPSGSSRTSHENQPPSAEDLEEQTNNCVRLVLYRAGSGTPITRKELMGHVRNSRNFGAVIERAKSALKEIYGYTLHECEDSTKSKSKVFIVGNCLEHIDFEQSEGRDIPEDCNKILIMLILTHIFMCGGTVSENSLMAFLKSLNIGLEKKHLLFGNVPDFINNRLTKSRYLSVQVDESTKKTVYSWGIRAEKQVSKLQILNFVAKMYKDRKPQSWNVQYEKARQQHLNITDDENTHEEQE